MKREDAELIVRAAYKVSYILDENVRQMQAILNDDEFSKHRIRIGTVLAEVLEQLIEPAVEGHPDMLPTSKEGWQAFRLRTH